MDQNRSVTVSEESVLKQQLAEAMVFNADAKKKLRILEQLQGPTPESMKVFWDDVRVRDEQGRTRRKRAIRTLEDLEEEYTRRYRHESIEASLEGEPGESGHSGEEQWWFNEIRSWRMQVGIVNKEYEAQDTFLNEAWSLKFCCRIGKEE